MAESKRPFIFVAVGTDHHPFNRLIEWVDEWLLTDRVQSVACIMQSGTARPPRHSQWRAYLSHDEMAAALRDATAVVSHGGPGTIMACRDLGRLPIVVARRGRLGEHVDDHQVAFAEKMAAQGELWLAESEERLRALLNRAIEEPADFWMPPRRGAVDRTVSSFSLIVDGLLHERKKPRGRRWWSRGVGLDRSHFP